MPITQKQALEAVNGSRGFISTIAGKLGCSRKHVYTLLKKWESMRQALEEERESTKDYVESQLFKKIENNDLGAIIFYLKCQAKDRGYVERQEIAGPKGGPLDITIKWPEGNGLNDSDG